MGKIVKINDIFCRDYKKLFVEQTGAFCIVRRKTFKFRNNTFIARLKNNHFSSELQFCRINLATALVWRHNILDAIQNIMNDVELDGIAQTYETYSTVSYKGNHKSFKSPRPSHKRGTRVAKRGIFKEQVCIPCGVNHISLSIARINNLDKPSLKDL